MEMKREMRKAGFGTSSSFSDMISDSNGGALISSSFDYLPQDQSLTGERSGSSLGFMELLGVNDYFTHPTNDTIPQNLSFDFPMTLTHHTTMKPENHNNNFLSEGLIININQPETPNTSSISSASSDAANNEDQTHYKITTQDGEVEEVNQDRDQNEEVHDRTKKL